MFFKKRKSAEPVKVTKTVGDSVYASQEEYERYSRWARRTEKFIDRLAHETKCRIFYTIVEDSDRKWPEKTPIDTIKPEYWGELSESQRRDYINRLENCIEGSVGIKGLDRYYYQTICGYTDQQFDDWWESHGRKKIH